MLRFTDRLMGASYNTQTLPVLSKINKEKNSNYKASLSPWGNKKPLLTNCSLHIHTLYIIISFFREAERICLPDTGVQQLLVCFTSGRPTASVGPTSMSGLRTRRPLTTLSIHHLAQATGRGACHLLNPRRDLPRFSCFLLRPKEFKPSPVQLIKSKCVSITGRLFDKRSCYLCCHFLVVWNCTDDMIPERINQLP